MNVAKTREETTSADDKALGFDYQFYYFIYLLLGLEGGQTIGLEVKDDVHIDLGSTRQVLYQLKHSVQTKADGSIINLTAKDSDLWKTLSNWCLSIVDPASGRANKKDQIEFCRNTSFILATNKGLNIKTNDVISSIENFKMSALNVADLKNKFSLLVSDPKAKVDLYIEIVCSLDDEVFELFFQNLSFESGQDDIINKIKLRIKAKQIRESRIDPLLASLESSLRQDNYLTVLSGNQNIISFDEFYKKYCRHFELARQTSLQITRKYDFSQYDVFKDGSFEEQTFVKQLLDMGDVTPDEIEDIILYTKQKLLAHNNMEDWIVNGDLTNQEKVDYIGECVAKWRLSFNRHNKLHKRGRDITKTAGSDLTPDEIASGISCLEEVRSTDLSIDGQDLGTEISNGQYYLLAEDLMIGWVFDFEARYKE